METEASIQAKFNAELFGLMTNWRHETKNIWQRYKSALKNEHNYSYDFVEMVVAKNLPRKVFQNCDELIIWFRENQKWLCKVWKKLNFGK